MSSRVGIRDQSAVCLGLHKRVLKHFCIESQLNNRFRLKLHDLIVSTALSEKNNSERRIHFTSIEKMLVQVYNCLVQSQTCPQVSKLIDCTDLIGSIPILLKQMSHMVLCFN